MVSEVTAELYRMILKKIYNQLHLLIYDHDTNTNNIMYQQFFTFNLYAYDAYYEITIFI